MLFTGEQSGRLHGIGSVGQQVESLILEGTLGLNLALSPRVWHLTIHPHPTLGETVSEGAELDLDFATHLRG